MILSKCRRVLWALTNIVFVLTPWSAWSLGLGEIDVDSALNEKFAATITLTEVGGLQDGEVIVSLASLEDFERVGVERFHYLTGLDFSVDIQSRRAIVRISSDLPVSEPYLNFIVEVLWPRGRLLKEFTALLDPPAFTSTAAPRVSVPAETRLSEAVAVREEGAPSRVAPERVSLPTQSFASAREGEVFTAQDETLWKIANRTRSDQVDVNQQMLAIQALNPEAFIRNNINLLKAGYRLTLPTRAQALNISPKVALADVFDQASAWRNPLGPSSGRSVATDEADTALQSQVDATPQIAPVPMKAETGQGQVRIVAASGDFTQGNSTESTEASRLLESNESLSSQVDELEYQLDREKEIATNQIELKSRELEIKDQELAALQARLDKLEEQITNQRQNQTTPSPAVELPLWQSPFVLGGAIGVLVLLLVMFLIRGRKTVDGEEVYDLEPEQETDDEILRADDVEGVAAVEPSTGEPEPEALLDAGQPQGVENQLAEEPATPQSEGDATEEVQDAKPAASDSASTADLIEEADIYVAYGRHVQAISLLRGALEIDPSRHDVRLKLLEVCVDAEDPVQFGEHADYLLEHCSDEDILMSCRELEARLDGQVLVLEGSDIEKELPPTVAVAGEEDHATGIDESDLDSFNIDDLIETESMRGEGASPGTQGDDASTREPERDFELEFDLDDDGADDSQTEGVSLGDDLGRDFDPDEPIQERPADKAESEASFQGEGGDFDFLDRNEAERTSVKDIGGVADEGDEFNFAADDDTDINTTKIDLAEAYIDMGDDDGARDVLNEVIEQGSPEHKAIAQKLLDSIEP